MWSWSDFGKGDPYLGAFLHRTDSSFIFFEVFLTFILFYSIFFFFFSFLRRKKNDNERKEYKKKKKPLFKESAVTTTSGRSFIFYNSLSLGIISFL